VSLHILGVIVTELVLFLGRLPLFSVFSSFLRKWNFELEESGSLDVKLALVLSGTFI